MGIFLTMEDDEEDVVVVDDDNELDGVYFCICASDLEYMETIV